MKCINCGNEIQDGVVTCPFCNSNLNNQVPVTPTAPVLPQDQNMVVTPEAPVMNAVTEPIAEVQEPISSDPMGNNNVEVESAPQPTIESAPQVAPFSPAVPTPMDVQPAETPVSPVVPTPMDVQPTETPVSPVVPTPMDVQSAETPVSPVVPTPMDAQPAETPVTPVAPQTPVAEPTPVAPGPQTGVTVNLDALSTPESPQPAMASVPPINNQGGEKIGSSAPVIENKSKKKKNMIIFIVLAVILVLVGAGVFIYFYEFKSADKRIEILSKNLFSFTKNIKNDSVELSSGKYSVSGGITADKETISFDVNGTYGVDLKNQILDLTLNANSIKVGEELLPEPLNVELYLNDSKAYVLLQNFYDKYIYTEFPEMKELFDSLSEEDINYVVLVKGIENAFSVAAKSTNSTQTVEDVKINEKTQKANVIRIVATAGNKKLFANNFYRALANNTSFIKEYAKVTDKTEGEAKEEMLNNLKDATYENDPNSKIEIYSPLVGNSLLGLKVYGKDEETKEVSIIEAYPIANGYAINATTGGKSVLKGQFTNSVKKTSKTENTTVSVSFTMFNDDTTAKVDFAINVEDDVNPKVEKVNVKNSVDVRYLTPTDQQTIISKVSNYGQLGMYLSQFINSSSAGFDGSQGASTSSCQYAFNCTPSGDGVNNTCQVCDDLTQTCMMPNTITCPIG